MGFWSQIEIGELGWDFSEPAILVHVIHKWYSFRSNLKTAFFGMVPTIFGEEMGILCCFTHPDSHQKTVHMLTTSMIHFLRFGANPQQKCACFQKQNEAVMMVVWNPVFTWRWIATVGYAFGLSGYKYEQDVSKGSIWTISAVRPGTFKLL